MLNVTLEDIMSPGIVVVPATATVAAAAHLLLRHRINGIVVISPRNRNRVVGLLDTADLVSLLDKALSRPRHRLKALAKIANTLVGDVAVKKVVTVQKDAKVAKVIALMHRKKIYTLPVCDGKKIIGVIGRHDILNVAFSG